MNTGGRAPRFVLDNAFDDVTDRSRADASLRFPSLEDWDLIRMKPHLSAYANDRGLPWCTWDWGVLTSSARSVDHFRNVPGLGRMTEHHQLVHL